MTKYGGIVYIMTNKNHTTFYTGVTSDLLTRTIQHRTHYFPGSFTSRYRLHKLVYYQFFNRIELAIAYEKQIKAGSRLKNINLIKSFNAGWVDLFDEIYTDVWRLD